LKRHIKIESLIGPVRPTRRPASSFDRQVLHRPVFDRPVLRLATSFDIWHHRPSASRLLSSADRETARRATRHPGLRAGPRRCSASVLVAKARRASRHEVASVTQLLGIPMSRSADNILVTSWPISDGDQLDRRTLLESLDDPAQMALDWRIAGGLQTGLESSTEAISVSEIIINTLAFARCGRRNRLGGGRPVEALSPSIFSLMQPLGASSGRGFRRAASPRISARLVDDVLRTIV